MEQFSFSDEKLEYTEKSLRPKIKLRKFLIIFVATIILLYAFFVLFLSAPSDFPTGTIFRVEHGNSLRAVSSRLKNEHFIRSRLAFEAFVIIFGRRERVIEADYYFEEKLPVYMVARRISTGEHHIAPVSVTIPEGFNTSQIAEVFDGELPNFDKDKFLLEAKELEGRLFPDTYFFFVTADQEEVIKSMNDNFNKKIKILQPDILAVGKTEKSILIMASLVEGEGKSDADRDIISGILWKRISLGMPLQVDVAPETYKSTGLPKNPIGNPGIESIKSAIYPQTSPYLYYLHDKNGIIHYAKSFAEHRSNVLKYLK